MRAGSLSGVDPGTCRSRARAWSQIRRVCKRMRMHACSDKLEVELRCKLENQAVITPGLPTASVSTCNEQRVTCNIELRSGWPT